MRGNRPGSLSSYSVAMLLQAGGKPSIRLWRLLTVRMCIAAPDRLAIHLFDLQASRKRSYHDACDSQKGPFPKTLDGPRTVGKGRRRRGRGMLYRR